MKALQQHKNRYIFVGVDLDLGRPFLKSHVQRNCLWVYIQMSYLKILQEYELHFGIKLKLKVCSLQWYQKLNLLKMLFVSLFCESASHTGNFQPQLELFALC